jgi:hypothetical protein
MIRARNSPRTFASEYQGSNGDKTIRRLRRRELIDRHWRERCATTESIESGGGVLCPARPLEVSTKRLLGLPEGEVSSGFLVTISQGGMLANNSAAQT